MLEDVGEVRSEGLSLEVVSEDGVAQPDLDLRGRVGPADAVCCREDVSLPYQTAATELIKYFRVRDRKIVQSPHLVQPHPAGQQAHLPGPLPGPGQLPPHYPLGVATVGNSAVCKQNGHSLTV